MRASVASKVSIRSARPRSMASEPMKMRASVARIMSPVSAGRPAGDLFDEPRIERIDFALQIGAHGVGQWPERMAVDLVRARIDQRRLAALQRQFGRLIQVHQDDANRPGDGRRRNHDVGCRRRDPVGGRRPHVVDHGGDRLLRAGGADQLRQAEHAGRFAARRVDVQEDRADLRIGKRGLQLHADGFVRREAGRVFADHHAAIDQRADHRQHRHAIDPAIEDAAPHRDRFADHAVHRRAVGQRQREIFRQRRPRLRVDDGVDADAIRQHRRDQFGFCRM